MKRFHVHVRVQDLQPSITFYNALFGTPASVVKADYAKWMLDDPRVNFAISTGHQQTGIEHLGIQTESPEELAEVYTRMQTARGQVFVEGETTCCYAKSQKSWITDPQGVEWEAFYTHGAATTYGEGRNTRPAPAVMERWTEREAPEALPVTSCCGTAAPRSVTDASCC